MNYGNLSGELCMKNYVKTALCVPVFLWIMGASVLFAQEVEDEPKRKKRRPSLVFGYFGGRARPSTPRL